MTILTRGADRLLELHAAELPQKDELCGCFWATLALRLHGEESVEQDDVALLAGSAITSHGHQHVLPLGQAGRNDFRVELPLTDDDDASGTSAHGVVRAVEEITGGRLVALPVPGLGAPALRALLRAAAEGTAPVALVANVQTGSFWGSHPTAAQLAAYLERGDVARGHPPTGRSATSSACSGSTRAGRARSSRSPTRIRRSAWAACTCSPSRPWPRRSRGAACSSSPSPTSHSGWRKQRAAPVSCGTTAVRSPRPQDPARAAADRGSVPGPAGISPHALQQPRRRRPRARRAAAEVRAPERRAGPRAAARRRRRRVRAGARARGRAGRLPRAQARDARAGRAGDGSHRERRNARHERRRRRRARHHGRRDRAHRRGREQRARAARAYLPRRGALRSTSADGRSSSSTTDSPRAPRCAPRRSPCAPASPRSYHRRARCPQAGVRRAPRVRRRGRVPRHPALVPQRRIGLRRLLANPGRGGLRPPGPGRPVHRPSMAPDCLVCREIAGDVPVPGACSGRKSSQRPSTSRRCPTAATRISATSWSSRAGMPPASPI